MESAATDLEAELGALEKDSEDTLARIRATVGDLSDLRYGKFDKPVDGDNVAEVVLEELRNLEGVCEGLLEGDDSGTKV
jgi:centromere-localized protein 2